MPAARRCRVGCDLPPLPFATSLSPYYAPYPFPSHPSIPQTKILRLYATPPRLPRFLTASSLYTLSVHFQVERNLVVVDEWQPPPWLTAEPDRDAAEEVPQISIPTHWMQR